MIQSYPALYLWVLSNQLSYFFLTCEISASISYMGELVYSEIKNNLYGSFLWKGFNCYIQSHYEEAFFYH